MVDGTGNQGAVGTGNGTGRFGWQTVTSAPSAIASGGTTLLGDGIAALRAPLLGSASAGDIALAVGVILVAVILWNFVLLHIRLAAETI